MKPIQLGASRCCRCQFYTPEGRRGGACSQLGVSVHGSWKACSLAIPPFSTSLPELTQIDFWPNEFTVSTEKMRSFEAELEETFSSSV
ncbi:MAG: hypothetical protein AAF215_04565 [Cyanobacteria bacterium P01_A01_bin.123]